MREYNDISGAVLFVYERGNIAVTRRLGSLEVALLVDGEHIVTVSEHEARCLFYALSEAVGVDLVAPADVLGRIAVDR